MTAQISAQQVYRLDKAETLWFSSVRGNGSPHTVPVWFVYSSGEFWVASPAASRKLENVRNNPRVTIAVDGSPPRTLVAEGAVVIHEQPREYQEQVSQFKRKYRGFDVGQPSVAGPLVLLEISVSRWLLNGDPQ